jgi:hypothetical protein
MARARAKAYAALLTAAALLGLGIAPASHAAPATAPQADNGRWSVFPAPAAGAKDKSPTAQERSFFTLQGAPGTVLKDKVSVSNLSSKPMTFTLYGADAYNTPRDGGFAVRGNDEKMTDLGSWVSLAASTVKIPARTRADIPFTVTIPAGATPGDHPGAIVALDTQVDKAKGKVAVGVRRAVGARVYLKVSGPTLPAMSVEHVTVTHGQPLIPGTGDSTATISYTLVNRGNVSLNPRVAFTAKGLFGRTLLTRKARTLPLELLPGQSVTLTERWAHAPQFDRVSLRLTATSARGDLSETGSVHFLAVPWLVTGAVLLVLAALVAWLVRRVRRRRGRQEPAAGEPEQPKESEQPEESEEREATATLEAILGSGKA